MEKKPTHVKPSLYSFYYELIKEVSRDSGYNILVHGSMNRDLDLLIVPWENDLGDIEKLIDDIATIIGGEVMMQNRSVENEIGYRYSDKPHGRRCYIININRDFEMEFNGMVARVKDYSSPQYYLDISVIGI